jgi:hypothetical protein
LERTRLTYLKEKLMLPSQIRILRVLIGIQVYRLAGISLLWFFTSLPSVFLIPTVTGDTLTAIFAPVIAFAITRKKGPRTWAAALVWNVLGMVDLFYALTIGSLTAAGSFVQANDPGVVIGATIGIILHLTSIGLLLRRINMSYLITSP